MHDIFPWISQKRFQGTIQSSVDNHDINIFFENPVQMPPSPSRLMIICHPNPLAQGTMHHKVPTVIARCAHVFQYCTLRFQFCGVEGTSRPYKNFNQQVQLLNELIERFEEQGFTAPILAGFSFGAACVLQSKYNGPKLAIAPAWHLMQPGLFPACSELSIIHAKNDPICSAAQSYENISHIDCPSKRLVILGEGEHFLKAIPPELLAECQFFFEKQSKALIS